MGVVLETLVMGEPVPQARPRVTTRGTYEDPRCSAWKDVIGWSVKAHRLRSWPSTSPVHVRLLFVRSSHRRVDVDNLAKAVMDALQPVVIADDSQVKELLVQVRVGAAPGVAIGVMELDEEHPSWVRAISPGEV